MTSTMTVNMEQYLGMAMSRERSSYYQPPNLAPGTIDGPTKEEVKNWVHGDESDEDEREDGSESDDGGDEGMDERGFWDDESEEDDD